MESLAELREKHSFPADKQVVLVRNKADGCDVSTIRDPTKRRLKKSAANLPTVQKKGTTGAQGRAVTETRKNKEGKGAAKKKATARARAAATRGATGGNTVGNRGLRRKIISDECEEVKNLKAQLAIMQRALQKVLQSYCVEPHPPLPEDKDASEATPNLMMRREVQTLKKLVSILTGGHVPLPVPPDFFYVLGKQYLDGTWTDICAAAAREAADVSGQGTETEANVDRKTISVDTVHKYPSSVTKEVLDGTSSPAQRMPLGATTGAAAPQPSGVSGAMSNTAQVEEVEQLIRVEIEGEEPMEFRDVYRLPVEGPPVLISSSASKATYAATASTSTAKYDASESSRQNSRNIHGTSSLPPNTPITSMRQNITDVQQEERQQQGQSVFTNQQQHASERACKASIESRRSSPSSVEDSGTTVRLPLTPGGHAARLRQVTTAGESLMQSCSATGCGTTSRIGVRHLGKKKKSASSTSDSDTSVKGEPRDDALSLSPRPSPPGPTHNSLRDGVQQEIGGKTGHISKADGPGGTWDGDPQRLQVTGGTKACSSAVTDQTSTSEVPAAVKSPRGENGKEEGLRETDRVSGFSSKMPPAASATAAPQQKLQFASRASAYATLAAAEKQQNVRKAAEVQRGDICSTASSQNMPQETQSAAAPTNDFLVGGSGNSGSSVTQNGKTSFGRPSTNVSSLAVDGTLRKGKVTGEDAGNSSEQTYQCEPGLAEHSADSTTRAITSLFAEEDSQVLTGRPPRTTAETPIEGKEKPRYSVAKLSPSRDEWETDYFVPAPRGQPEPGAGRSNVEVSYVGNGLQSAFPATGFQQEGHGRHEEGVKKTGTGADSAFPVHGLATTSAPSAAGPAGIRAGEKREVMRRAYTFSHIPSTRADSAPPRASSYTPTRLPPSPPPSPVFPFPLAAGAMAAWEAAEHSNLNDVAAAARRILMSSSAAYPCSAVLRENMAHQPPSASPPFRVPGGWQARAYAATLPLVNCSAASAEAALSDSPRIYRKDVDANVQAKQQDHSKAVTGAPREETHTETEEEDGNILMIRRGSGSLQNTGSGEQKTEQAERRTNTQVYILPPPANGPAAPLLPHTSGEVTKRDGVQQPPQQAEAAVPPQAVHPADAAGSPSVGPRWQTDKDEATAGTHDVLANRSEDSDYDEAAAAALGFKVYRHRAGTGGPTYDVFETAAVQAVLLAHAQEVSVPVFWNETGRPVSWPRVNVSLAASATALGPQSSVTSSRQDQRAQNQLYKLAQGNLEAQRRKQVQWQNAVIEGGDNRQTSFFAPVPGVHGVEPQKPPQLPGDMQTGRHPRVGLGVTRVPNCPDSAPFASGAAPDAAAAARTAASTSLPPSRTSENEDVSVTPGCYFKQPPLPPCSGLPGIQLLASTCGATASNFNKAEQKGRNIVRNVQEQRHSQRQWAEREEPQGSQAAAYRSVTAADAAHQTRQAPPADTAAARQGRVADDASGPHAAAREPAAQTAETVSIAATPATVVLPFSSSRGSAGSVQRSRVTRQQQRARAEVAGNIGKEAPSDRRRPKEEVQASVDTLDNLDNILREARDLDARLKEVDGKVARLLKGRKSAFVSA